MVLYEWMKGIFTKPEGITLKHSAHVIEQRRNKIIELLQKEGKQQVNALSEYFHVSPLTIRRDLNELEAIGLVKESTAASVYIKSLNHCHLL